MKHTVSTPTDEHGQSIVRGDNRSRRAGSSSSSSSEESMGKEDERIKQYNALAAARRRATTIAAKSDHPGEAGDGTGAEDAPHKAVRFTRARLDEVVAKQQQTVRSCFCSLRDQPSSTQHLLIASITRLNSTSFLLSTYMMTRREFYQLSLQIKS